MTSSVNENMVQLRMVYSDYPNHEQQTSGCDKMIDFKEYQDEINRICQKHQVKSLTVFGSALSDQFDESSDIDFLLELETAKGGIKRYMKIKFELEDLFTRPVDLVMPKAVTNQRIKKYMFSNTREIYAA